jgi:uncharacterized Rossmann fold enzyme
MPINEENISIGKIFNRYGDDFQAEQDIKDLKAQQRKRNLVIAGYMVVGAVGGYIVGRYLKLATWKKVSATVLGSLVFGGTVYLVTKPKAKRRKENIKSKQQTLEQAKYLIDKLKESAEPKTPTYVLTNPTKPDDSFKDVMSPIITNK